MQAPEKRGHIAHENPFMAMLRPALRRLLPHAALALVLSLAASGPALAAEAPKLPLLRGVLLDGAGSLFSLADSGGNATWVALGQTHGGWRLESFDAERRILILGRDGERHELALENARILASESRATTAEADALLEKIRFEDMIVKSLEIQRQAMTKALQQGGAGQNLSEAEKARLADFQAKVAEIMLEEMDLPTMRKEMAQVMTEVFTAEELRAQSAFYSTAAGQATLEKQPILQSRMTDLMMPRMMKAMPRIQALSMETLAAGKAAPDSP